MIYLDNSATTKAFDAVVHKMEQAMREAFFNPSSLYAKAMEPAAIIKDARDWVARAVGGARQVVFTSGGTESDNLAIFGMAQALRGRKGRFICSAIEHPGVLNAMERLRQNGHEVFFAPVDGQGVVLLDELLRLVDEKTVLVSIMQVNNETGAVQPIRKISEGIKQINPQVKLHVDGVQGFLRVPTDLKKDGIDFYSLSAHKIHGPKGIGALCMAGKENLLPVIYGGGQEAGLRSGTENVPGIAGLGSAIETYIGINDVSGQLFEMKKRLAGGILNGVPAARVNGPEPGGGAPHILNISFPVRGEVLLHALEGEGVYVSTGSACANIKKSASHVLKAMDLSSDRVEGAIRFSLSPMNTLEEMDEAAQIVCRQVQTLKRFKRR